MSEDPFAHDDAAYLLGALGPAERRAFEEHLARCAECTRRVRDLAGLPGLLAALDPADFADPTEPPPVPDTLLPGLLREVRRRRRRSRVVLVASAVAAAVLAVAFVWSLAVGGQAEPGPTAAPAPTRTMTQVDQQVVTAAFSLQKVGWGTRIRLSCTYSGDSWGQDPDQPTPSYALVVRTADGRSAEVATWKVVPGRAVDIEGATAADPADISGVDVVMAGTGRRLLTWTPTG